MRLRPTFTLLLTALVGSVAAQPILTGAPASGEQMRFDPAGSSVTPDGLGGWDVVIRAQPDNENTGLPSSYRGWWHLQIENLNAVTGASLDVTITNLGIYDFGNLPTWAQSTDGGTSFGPYERIPDTPGANALSFDLQTPVGVDAIRLAKYFPYTPASRDALLDSLQGDHRVTQSVIGQSEQGRPIPMLEITDPTVPSQGKHRVWVHTAVHPAETTSYFTMEGLVAFLVSDDPLAHVLRDQVIVDIVPMANPDGVFLGNYRTNADSVNLEIQWASPYNSPVAEIVALRTQIEEFMGDSSDPGDNPIELLFNLHSSHGGGAPFHFVHRPDYNIDGTGVTPEVNALEVAWVAAFRNRSPLVGGSSLSSLSGRPFVESMMHDRWSIDPLWVGSPNNLPRVMAITYEGTYSHTPDDYRQNGWEMGQAIADFFGIAPVSAPAGLMVR